MTININLNWKDAIANPPTLSCRVIVCFVEFGFNERHMCMGYYHHTFRDKDGNSGKWEFDAEEYNKYTPAYWVDMDELLVPKNDRKPNTGEPEPDATGIAQIAAERNEMIEKHGRTVQGDVDHNSVKTDYGMYPLAQGAVCLLDPVMKRWPSHWNTPTVHHLKNKDYKGRLAVAGAFIAAELDRLNGMPEGEEKYAPNELK